MIRRAFLVFLVFGVTVCGDDSTGPESVDDSTGPDESVVGTYTLQSVGGDALPWVLLQFLGDKVEVTAGSIILNQDMTCSSSTTSSVTESGNVTTITETDMWLPGGNSAEGRETPSVWMHEGIKLASHVSATRQSGNCGSKTVVSTAPSARIGWAST